MTSSGGLVPSRRAAEGRRVAELAAEAGQDPLGVIRDPAKNTPMISIPRERDAFFTHTGGMVARSRRPANPPNTSSSDARMDFTSTRNARKKNSNASPTYQLRCRVAAGVHDRL